VSASDGANTESDIWSANIYDTELERNSEQRNDQQTVQEHENFSDPLTQECLTNYSNYVDTMKQSYDRNRLTNIFNVGDCVGVIIPLELRKNGIQLLPALVLAREEKPSEYVYQLGVHGAILERYYLSSDLVPLSLPAFRKPLGIPDTLHIFDVIDGVDWWGWDEDKRSCTYTELSAAYTAYIKYFSEGQENASAVKDMNHYEFVAADEHVIRLRRVQRKIIEVITIDDDLNAANDLISLQSTSQRETRGKGKTKAPVKQKEA
jgi:hypothetical protein